MTHIKRLIAILAAIAAMAVLFQFVLPPIQRTFALSEEAVGWVAGAIGVPLAWLAFYGVPSFDWMKGVPTMLLVYRVLGVVIAVAGGALAFGNKTGLLPTFPFAGTLTIGVGVLVFFGLGKAPAAGDRDSASMP